MGGEANTDKIRLRRANGCKFDSEIDVLVQIAVLIFKYQYAQDKFLCVTLYFSYQVIVINRWYNLALMLLVFS